MLIKKEVITKREKYCNSKLSEVIKEIDKIDFSGFKNTCIYITGSYARGEAGEKSDLDLFFINNSHVKIQRLKKIKIDYFLIRLTEKLNLPAFSKDGEYLQIHNIKNILEIGSQEEDYKNYFTARMLFILESKCLYNKKVYNKVLDEIINAYWLCA